MEWPWKCCASLSLRNTICLTEVISANWNFKNVPSSANERFMRGVCLLEENIVWSFIWEIARTATWSLLTGGVCKRRFNFFLDNFFCLSGSKSVLGCYGRITCSPKCSTFKVQCASVTSLLWEKRHLCFHFVFITKYIANLCTIKMYVHVHLSWSTVFMKEICCYDYIVLL